MQRITSSIRDQRGFTLIEIIMVIVLLGIIAAIAIPKYIDLRTEAADATYADLVTHNSASTFPAFTTLHNNYLQAQNITMNSDANGWWAAIGGVTYTFTYAPGTGNAGWTK
jgi:prepilin-type N-terminal cleavage/methylation domain-containing protein